MTHRARRGGGSLCHDKTRNGGEETHQIDYLVSVGTIYIK